MSIQATAWSHDLGLVSSVGGFVAQGSLEDWRRQEGRERDGDPEGELRELRQGCVPLSVSVPVIGGNLHLLRAPLGELPPTPLRAPQGPRAGLTGGRCARSTPRGLGPLPAGPASQKTLAIAQVRRCGPPGTSGVESPLSRTRAPPGCQGPIVGRVLAMPGTVLDLWSSGLSPCPPAWAESLYALRSCTGTGLHQASPSSVRGPFAHACPPAPWPWSTNRGTTGRNLGTVHT